MEIRMDDVDLFERLSLDAHPALDYVLYDGWLMQFSDGYTDRANSIYVLEKGELDLNDKIAYCEGEYARRGLPCNFKITPKNIDMDIILSKRDYNIVTPTYIMSMSLESSKSTKELDYPANYVFEVGPLDSSWEECSAKLESVEYEKMQIAKRIHSKIKGEVFGAKVSVDGRDIACAMGVADGIYLGLYNVFVFEEYRRKGLAEKLINDIFAKAYEFGARKAYLQVVRENKRAIALYSKMVFCTNYTYWYRKKMQ